MSFLPDGFGPPSVVETARFRLRPITIHDAVKDYVAVMSSCEKLWARFGELWGWPPSDLTLEQDMIDLAWHQKEAQLGFSFNFAVMSLDETQLLGCVYLDPPVDDRTQADVWLWVRQSESATGLEAEVESVVLSWLAESWPFETITLCGVVRPVPRV